MKLKGLYLVLLMLCMSSAAFSQEKYEQAIVMQAGTNIILSLEGKETVIEKNPTKGTGGVDFSFLLSKIAGLRNEGWEVWNSNSGSTTLGVVYFLRRKLK